MVASDNKNENWTTVVIHVNDVNDNPPVFDRPTYETQITEEDDRNLPKRVLKVKEACSFVWCFSLVEIVLNLLSSLKFFVFSFSFSFLHVFVLFCSTS